MQKLNYAHVHIYSRQFIWISMQMYRVKLGQNPHLKIFNQKFKFKKNLQELILIKILDPNLRKNFYDADPDLLVSFQKKF